MHCDMRGSGYRLVHAQSTLLCVEEETIGVAKSISWKQRYPRSLGSKADSGTDTANSMEEGKEILISMQEFIQNF